MVWECACSLTRGIICAALQVKISIVRRRTTTKSFKTIINNYVLSERLGQGSFGQVFLGKSLADGKLYAVKHINRANLRKKKFCIKADAVCGGHPAVTGQQLVLACPVEYVTIPPAGACCRCHRYRYVLCSLSWLRLVVVACGVHVILLTCVILRGPWQEALREISVMKRLQHRNIVTLYEVIDDPTKDCFYMVQEYMDLGPVLGESEHNQFLKPDVVRKYLVDVLHGLDYLHFQGVVHR